VTIVAIGPLTNLAFAEIKHPGLLKRAKAVLVMGGAAFCPGNANPSSEFNFNADAVAAHVALTAGANLLLFGLDVTSKAVMSSEWIASFEALNTNCARAAHGMLRAYVVKDPKLHDACPVAYLLNPGMFASESCAVAVDWHQGETEGHLNAWPASRAHPPHAATISVFTHVDRERLLSLVRGRILALP
jgi:purine nucleosidase